MCTVKKVVVGLICTLLLCVGPMAMASGETVYQDNISISGTSLQFDAAVSQPDSLNAQKLQVRTMQWTQEDLESLFGVETAKVPQNQGDGDKVIDDTLDNLLLDYVGDEDIDLYSYIDGTIEFRAAALERYYVRTLVEGYLDESCYNRSLESYPFVEAEEDARAILRELRLEAGEVVWAAGADESQFRDAYTRYKDHYIISYNEFVDNLDEGDPGKIRIGPEYFANKGLQPFIEGYVMEFELSLAGVPCIQDEYFSASYGDMINGCRAILYITKEKILYLSISGGNVGYEVIGVKANDSNTSMELGAAVQSYINYLQEAVYFDPITVIGIEYRYVARPVKGKKYTFTMVPAWVFYETRESVEYVDRVILNAYTGKVIGG